MGKKSTSIQSGSVQTCKNVLSLAEAKEMFLSKLAKKPNGEYRQIASDFLDVMSIIYATRAYQTFTITDVVRLSSYKNLYPPELRTLFDKWTSAHLEAGLIKEVVPSIYEERTFINPFV